MFFNFSASPVIAQSSNFAEPGPTINSLKAGSPTAIVEFDSNKLKAIDSYVEKEIADGKMVGCSALIFQDDQVVYRQEWGLRNRKKDLPVTEDTIWRIYSMSKPITSVAVMQLVEQGKIDLDQPISTYLPEFKTLKVFKKSGDPKLVTEEPKREMNTRDLLRHTSGLTYGFFGNSPVDQAYRRAGILVTDAKLSETITKLSKIPLQYQPGTRWHYGVSTDVLGRVVEVASGMSFKEYLDKNIFGPLKMTDTFFSVPKDKQNRFAEMYRFQDGKLVPASPMASIRFVSDRNEFYSGGGGLCSTTDDYLRFARMLLNKGELDGIRILKAETIAEMTRDQLPKSIQSREFKFGLGFRIDKNGHFSWGGAAGTRFWVDPNNKMITVFMVQINPYRGGHGAQFKKLTYAALND